MSKSKVSGKKLIIQLGRDETLLALWDKGPQFLYTTSVPTPEGAVEDGEIRDADAVREMLQAALEAPEFQNVRNAIYSLCTSRVITETVTTPEMPAKKLGKLIQANIDMYFPVDMTDYRLVWQTIGPKTSSTGMKELLVQLWAVPNSILGPYYAVANACGLSVAAIDYCGNSIATAVGASFAMDGKGTKKKARKIDLNKDISLGRKKAALPDDLSPAMPEPGNNGTTDLHLTLEKDLIGVTFVQANRVVHQRFILTGSNPAYQFEEVAMMVEYFSSLDVGRGSTINGMVSGYLADDPHFVDELSEALDMPLSAFQAEFNPCWVICAGAAQTKLDFGNPDLNNAPKSVDTAATRVYHTAALAAGGAALAGVVALTFVARLSWDATLEALESRRMTLAIQAQKVAGYADKYNEYATLYDNYSNDWNIIFNSLRTYNDNLVRVMEELESILPEKTSVTALAIGNDGLNVQFACENKEEAAYLIMALRELQYADLTAISSLSGGGRGAANSYGNGEQAPTEGGIFVSEDVLEELGELFTKDFAPYNITSSLSSGQIQNMETNYGYLPETDIILDDGDETTPVVTHDCKTIAELEKVYSGVLNPGSSITADMRAAAIQNTLKTNPFSSYWFVKELKVDYNINSDNPMSIDRSKLFFWDLIGMYGYFEDNYGTNPLSYKTPEDAERVMTYFSDKICTTNDPNDSLTQEERVTETERLFKRNATLEQWYVYYLQEEINKDAEADTEESDIAVYLDMQAILDDVLVDGKFSSSDKVLNEGLTKLMSDETKAAVEKNIVAAPEVTPTPTPTPTAVIPTLKPTDNPTPTPSTSPTITPTPTNKPDSTLPGGITVEMVEEQLVKYADTGKTDYYPILDSQLDKYVTTGKTDYPEIDAALNAYIASGEGDELAKIMVKDYLENGKFGNETLNEAIDQYSKTGTTGNKVIDDRIEDFMESEEAEQIISDLLNDYIADGKTDYPYLDSMIEAYITKGTTGKPGFDKLIEKGMDDFARERWPNQTVVNTLLDKTKTSGKSGDSVFDLLYARYRIMKTTGSEYLDKLIFNYTMTNGSKDDVQNAIGGGGGGGGGPVDTRIAFTVVLGYNDDLMRAELERKGLSNDSMVEKLEVNS